MTRMEKLKGWAGAIVEATLGTVDPQARAEAQAREAARRVAALTGSVMLEDMDAAGALTERQRRAARDYMEEIAEEAVRRHFATAVRLRPVSDEEYLRGLAAKGAPESDSGEFPKPPAAEPFRPRADANGRATKVLPMNREPRRFEALEKIRAGEQLTAGTFGYGTIRLMRAKGSFAGVLRLTAAEGEDIEALRVKIVDAINGKD